ncbi:MAG: hypothetical protein ACRCTM_05980 [Sphaerotilus sulfidivorans]
MNTTVTFWRTRTVQIGGDDTAPGKCRLAAQATDPDHALDSRMTCPAS